MLDTIQLYLEGAACVAPFWFWGLQVVLGLVLGSFMGCALWRVPRKLSLRKPPSHCPHCQHILGVRDLVPVLSWLWQRGKCRYCQAPLSVDYVLIEVAVMGLWLLPWALLGASLAAFCLSVAVLCAFFVTVVRFKYQQLALKTLIFCGLMLIAFGVGYYHALPIHGQAC